MAQLQVYDTEPESCKSKLFEYKVTFPPRFESVFASSVSVTSVYNQSNNANVVCFTNGTLVDFCALMLLFACLVCENASHLTMRLD